MWVQSTVLAKPLIIPNAKQGKSLSVQSLFCIGSNSMLGAELVCRSKELDLSRCRYMMGKDKFCDTVCSVLSAPENNKTNQTKKTP